VPSWAGRQAGTRPLPLRYRRPPRLAADGGTLALQTDLFGPLHVPTAPPAPRRSSHPRPRGERTRRAYRAAWRQFDTWCRALGSEPLAPDPDTLACMWSAAPIRGSPSARSHLRFGMGLAATCIGEPTRRDRLLLIDAFAMVLFTMLGPASESLGMDRLLKSNTSKTEVQYIEDTYALVVPPRTAAAPARAGPSARFPPRDAGRRSMLRAPSCC
jgi:hypothetical protein